MANKYFQQFVWSLTHRLTVIQGYISMVQQVKASRVTQGITLTADAYGAAGNSITIAFTGGGTAGAEVVTVVGTAISVQIQSGVSTVTQVRTAINASTPAAALVDATGTSGSTVTTAAALALTGGVSGVASTSITGATAVQTGVGEVTITLDSTYNALVAAHASVMKAVAQDLVPQFVSEDVDGAKTVVVRLLTGATPTDPTAAMKLDVSLFLRNSSVVY